MKQKTGVNVITPKKDIAKRCVGRLGSPSSQSSVIQHERELSDSKLVSLVSKRMIGVGKVKQCSNVLEKPLNKGKQEVSI